MNPIEKRLKASINIDAVNGDRQERAICQNQMLEAANEITKLRERIKALEAELSTLRESMRDRYIYPNEGEQLGDLQPGLEYYNIGIMEWVPSGIAFGIYREHQGLRYRAKLTPPKPPEDSSERDIAAGGET